jgi:hypothetical protein
MSIYDYLPANLPYYDPEQAQWDAFLAQLPDDTLPPAPGGLSYADRVVLALCALAVATVIGSVFYR